MIKVFTFRIRGNSSICVRFFSIGILCGIFAFSAYGQSSLSNPVLVSLSDSSLGNVPGGAEPLGPPHASKSGRYVVFTSRSDLLTEDDRGGWDNLYLRDTVLNSTVMISQPEDGAPPNGSSLQGRISADGSRVVFWTQARNLLASGATGLEEIFAYDVQTDLLSLISIAWDGGLANSSSYSPDITADGRFVVFSSVATNLVEGWSGPIPHAFIRDIQLGETTPIVLNIEGVPLSRACALPQISGDGSTVLLSCDDSGVYIHDILANKSQIVSVNSNGEPANGDSSPGSISYDGRFVAFISFADNLSPLVDPESIFRQHYVHDRLTATTEIVSLNSAGIPNDGDSYARPRISSDGRYVAFETRANNHGVPKPNAGTNAFVRDREKQETTWISQAPNGFTHHGYTPFILGIGPNIIYAGFGFAPDNSVAFGVVLRTFEDNVFADRFE